MMCGVSDERYFGIYPAVVASTDDPFGFGRVQVTVPMVAVNEALWATVVVPSTQQDVRILPAVVTERVTTATSLTIRCGHGVSGTHRGCHESIVAV
jgi:hypothetical protein